jgi:WD40 repeat protein
MVRKSTTARRKRGGPARWILARRSAPIADGRYLMTASWDNTVRVWAAQSGVELLNYSQPNSNGFYYPYFTPDNQRVIRTWRPEECLKYLHSEACP